MLHVLRAMDIKANNDLESGLRGLYGIGQESFMQPSVFNFFTPQYSPEGPVADAGLVAPEAQLESSPRTVGYLTGMAGLASSNANSSFALHNIADLSFGQRNVVMHFRPSNPTNVVASVDELAVLFTAGRISNSSRAIIEAAYDNALSTMDGWYDMSNVTATMGPVSPATGLYSAYAAIDDYKGGAYAYGCATATATSTHVANGELPYWQVDLKLRVNVTHLKLVPRNAHFSMVIAGIDIEVDGVVCAANLTSKFEIGNIPCGLVGQV